MTDQVVTGPTPVLTDPPDTVVVTNVPASVVIADATIQLPAKVDVGDSVTVKIGTANIKLLGPLAAPPPSGWASKPAFKSYPSSAALDFENVTTPIVVSGKSFVGIKYPNSALRFNNCTGGIHVVDCDFDANEWDAIDILNCTGSIVIEWCRAGTFLYVAAAQGGRRPDFAQFAAGTRVTGSISNCKIKTGGQNEDIVNFNQSGGVDATHLFEMHHNAIEGGASGSPIPSTSGSGTMLADGTTTAGYVWVHDSTYLNPGQVGVGISEGLGCRVTDNIVYGSQRTGSNVGIYTPYVGGSPNPGNHEVSRNRVWWKNAAGTLNSFWNGGAAGTVAGLSPQTNTWDDVSIDPATLAVTL